MRVVLLLAVVWAFVWATLMPDDAARGASGSCRLVLVPASSVPGGAPRALSSLLGVLRRPQTVVDRSGLPGALRGLAARDVTLGGVRLAGDYGTNGQVELVPARFGKVTALPPRCFRDRQGRQISKRLRRLEAIQARKPTLCLVRVNADGSGTSSCAPPDAVRTEGVTASDHLPPQGCSFLLDSPGPPCQWLTYGAVPDKVASIVLVLTHHRMLRATVQSNVWMVGPTRLPFAGLTDIRWLDKHGKRLPAPHAPPGPPIVGGGDPVGP